MWRGIQALIFLSALLLFKALTVAPKEVGKAMVKGARLNSVPAVLYVVPNTRMAHLMMLLSCSMIVLLPAVFILRDRVKSWAIGWVGPAQTMLKKKPPDPRNKKRHRKRNIRRRLLAALTIISKAPIFLKAGAAEAVAFTAHVLIGHTSRQKSFVMC